MSDQTSEDPGSALTRPPDAYEAKFMGAGERVLHREKMSVPWWLHILVLASIIGGIIGITASGAPLGLVALPLVLGFLIWGSLATLRTTVSEDHLHIHYGIFGPTIDVGSIRRVEPTTYSWITYGGWGFRYSLRDQSFAYNMIGDGGRAVKLEYEKDGKVRKILVSSREPSLLADAIQRARRGLAADKGAEVVLDLETEDAAVASEESEQVTVESEVES